MMERDRLSYLIEQVTKGTATEAEIFELETFYNLFEDKKGYTDYLDHTQKNAYKELLYDRINTKINKYQQPLKLKKERGMQLVLRIAASVFIICGIALYAYYLNKSIGVHEKSLVGAQDSSKRDSKAVLTLANGQKIILTDAQVGVLSDEHGIVIHKTAEGKIVYTDKNQVVQAYINQIDIPKGEKYQIQLPDGTKVWLNTLSSLRYPAAFTGKEREVELKGEAYFEVAKNKNKPFRVKTASQTIEVLGTHFNINGYADESWTKTTLLEGSVKISHNDKSIILKPGQQALTDISTTYIRTSIVDTEEVLAWKNGYILFEDADIRSIMKKLSRWYDIEVEYDGEVTNQKFGGAFQQSASLEELLKYLESYGDVHFKTQGRRVIVMK